MNKIIKILKINLFILVLIVGGTLSYNFLGVEKFVLEKVGYIYNDSFQHLKKGLPINKAVKVYTGGGACSGFKLKSGHIVTAYHCKNSSGIYTIESKEDGDKLQSVEYEQLIKLTKKEKLQELMLKGNIHFHRPDIMILKKKGSQDALDVTEFSLTPIKKGDEVYILGTNGFTLISKLKVKPIKIERARYRGSIKTIWGKAYDVHGGTSGSGVVNSKGQLVGILVLGKGLDKVGITPIWDALK